MLDTLLKMLFWIGVLLVAQAAAFFPLREGFPTHWLYWSIGLGLLGIVLLFVLRELERNRGQESGQWRRSSDAVDSAGDIDD